MTIPTREETAHFVKASVVSLSPEGTTGIKTVEDDVVRFHEIDLISAEIGGLWASGPPQTARIVTVGQCFVREGETVRTQTEEELNEQQASATSAVIEVTQRTLSLMPLSCGHALSSWRSGPSAIWTLPETWHSAQRAER